MAVLADGLGQVGHGRGLVELVVGGGVAVGGGSGGCGLLVEDGGSHLEERAGAAVYGRGVL